MLVLLLPACRPVNPASAALPQARQESPAPVAAPVVPDTPCVMRSAVREIGVKETGTNSGPRVNQYLASTRLGPGFYWCSSFVHWNFSQCGKTFEPAREFAAAARFGREHVVYKKGEVGETKPGQVFTLYYANLKRIGHVGIILKDDEDYLTTCEGNTGAGGSRNGDGVYRRVRSKETVYTVNQW